MPPSRPPPLRRLCQAAALAVLAGALPLVLAATDTARMEDIARARYGEAVAAAVRDWRGLLGDADADELERLARVNTFFNRRLRFDDDSVVWKEPDYWATPLESLARGAGDCEDFAIAKYASLLVAGVSSERLRLIYVRARIGGPQSSLSQAHMVVGYYPTPDAEPLILDNLVGEIRPAGRRPDLFPVFSFTSEGLWVQGASTSSADPTARLSRWRSVLQRMRDEGLELPR
jgi:predicted transglutaminase-like cysteine proteinase